jgi:hypothetical protein
VYAQTEIGKDPNKRVSGFRHDSLKKFKVVAMNKNKSTFACDGLSKTEATRSFSITCITPVGDPSDARAGRVLLMPRIGRTEEDLLPYKDSLEISVVPDLCQRVAGGG